MGYDRIIAAVKKRQSHLLFDAYYERVNRLAYFCDAVKRVEGDERKEAISRVYYYLGSIRELSLPASQEQHHTFFQLSHDVYDEVFITDEGNFVNFNEENVAGLSDAIRQAFPELPFAWSHLHKMPLFPSSSQNIATYDAHQSGRYILSAAAPLVKTLSRRKGHQENQFDAWYNFLLEANQVIAIGEAGDAFGDYFTSSQSSKFQVENSRVEQTCSEDPDVIAQEILFDLTNIELGIKKTIRLFYLSMCDNKKISEDDFLLKNLLRFISYNDKPILVHSGYRGASASEMVLFLKACEYLKSHPLTSEQDEETFADWFHIETLTLRSLRFACENQAGILNVLYSALVVYEQHYQKREELTVPVSSYARMMNVLAKPSCTSNAIKGLAEKAELTPATAQPSHQLVGKVRPSALPLSMLLRTRSCSPFCDPSPDDSPCSPVSAY